MKSLLKERKRQVSGKKKGICRSNGRKDGLRKKNVDWKYFGKISAKKLNIWAITGKKEICWAAVEGEGRRTKGKGGGF